MNKFLLTFAAFAVVALSALSLGPVSHSAAHADDTNVQNTGQKTDVEKIEELLRKMAYARTAADALSYYAPSDHITLFAIAGEYKGSQAVREGMMKPYSWLKDQKVDFVEFEAETSGNLGYAQSVQYFTATVIADNKTIKFSRRVTTVLRKQKNGEWKIIHQHFSVPVDLKTGKAMMGGF